MGLSQMLARARPACLPLWQAIGAVPTGDTACTLFFSVSSGRERAHVEIARGPDWDSAWRLGAQALERRLARGMAPPLWLRVDVLDTLSPTTWGELKARWSRTKRNYFSQGIAFGADLAEAVLPAEIGANALLYDNRVPVCAPNAVNLKAYGTRRFGHGLVWPAADADPVWTFRTRAVFDDGAGTHVIEHAGRFAGHRRLPDWGEADVTTLVERSTGYLARQVQADGRYHYGWFPCFDRPIGHYNTLRHASSTYALLEGWEVTGRAEERAAIDRALDHLVTHLIQRHVLDDGSTVAYLVDTGDEIKLGGNAVCLLALVKHAELTGDRRHLPLMEQLALGMLRMQDPASGRFVHVLHHPTLALKAEHRIIYYDGEAAFGLMRLYGLTRDPRWLAAVEKAFDHFIAAEHWRAHDHWLSYCVNELTLHRPLERYFRFGLDNVRGHLDFVLERITTFPTLLELMMAAQTMIGRLQADPAQSHLLDGFDLEKFGRALAFRARYLANGFFWPELAMYFKNPARIVHGFFIRHHGFRVRIDDVEHYLSGYVAYRKHLRAVEPAHL